MHCGICYPGQATASGAAAKRKQGQRGMKTLVVEEATVIAREWDLTEVEDLGHTLSIR